MDLRPTPLVIQRESKLVPLQYSNRRASNKRGAWGNSLAPISQEWSIRKKRTEIGDPAAVIEWIAKCDKTDLIMMPTRGPGRFRRLLLGSVTSKILHDISCPVWTSAHNPEPVSALSLGYRLILCAVRMNLEDDVVLDVASIFVQICAARICLLYAQSATDDRNPEYISQSVKQAFRRVCVARRIQVTPDVSVRIMRTDLSAGIRHTALELGADLIIVGAWTRSRKLLACILAVIYNHSRIPVPCSERVMHSPEEFGDRALST